jgi:hypothetical protein
MTDRQSGIKTEDKREIKTTERERERKISKYKDRLCCQQNN